MSRVEEQLPSRTLAALLITLVMVLAPHVPRLPLWITAIVAICGVWRYLAGHRGLPLPPRWLRLTLVIAGAAGVYAVFGTLLGRDAGVAMLTLMTGLKLLEMRQRRDTLVVLYLAYFLIVTQFLYSQTIATAAYMFVVVFATTVLLITVNRRTGQGLALAHARTAAGMLLQAVPVMLVLFFLFPRLPGPLWEMPDEGGQAVTGLGEDMSPGSVSDLSLSDEVAFRAYFDGAPPEHRDRYWRGPVLAAYNGRTWTRLLRPGEPLSMNLGGEAVEQEIVLEPHGREWLFALDLAAEAPADGYFSAAREMLARSEVENRRRYSVTSYADYRLEPRLDDVVREAHTALPAGYHPRTRELAAELAADGAPAAEIVERGLNWLRERPFVYTLSPPLLPDEAVDRFLFETRRGFCEHFASAFTVLMRAAGVPARVVTGYQGGDEAADGSYLIVRQSNAHAWVEVWLPERGWRRVDPTGVVAPNRIELGLGGAVSDNDPVPLMARLDGNLLREFRLAWDLVNARWNVWVLGYDNTLQQRLLEWLGLDTLRRAVTALAVGLLAVMALAVALTMVRSRPASRSASVVAWDRACKRLAACGVARRPEEGPRDFARRVARLRPDLAGDFGAIASSYIRLRYDERGGAAELQRLRHRVRHFRPSRRTRQGLSVRSGDACQSGREAGRA